MSMRIFSNLFLKHNCSSLKPTISNELGKKFKPCSYFKALPNPMQRKTFYWDHAIGSKCEKFQKNSEIIKRLGYGCLLFGITNSIFSTTASADMPNVTQDTINDLDLIWIRGSLYESRGNFEEACKQYQEAYDSACVLYTKTQDPRILKLMQEYLKDLERTQNLERMQKL